MASVNDHSEINRFISHLTAAVNNIRLYSAGHPQASRYIQTAHTGICDLLREKGDITLLLVDQDIILDNQPLDADRSNTASFIRILRENGIERITFSNEPPEKEFSDFILCLASPEAKTISSTPAIKLGKVEIRVEKETIAPGQPLSQEQIEIVANLTAVRDTHYAELQQLYGNAKKRGKIDVRGLDGMIHAFISGFSRGLPPLELLAALKSADEYTFTHVVNVCILTMSQAESLGFKGDHLYNIGVASVLHDVGKLFIPDEIINKPDQLTREERGIIETHAVKGAQYILKLDNIPKLAVLGAMEHHIKFDGSGYPAMKGGWRPNIVSQMIAISDVFDALRSRRSYSEPKPQEVIKKILLQDKGTAFNPYLVDHFIRLIER
ncbi:MAG: HD-GYP domain-containing protein [Thermodesulfobacteriota bacterium]